MATKKTEQDLDRELQGNDADIEEDKQKNESRDLFGLYQIRVSILKNLIPYKREDEKKKLQKHLIKACKECLKLSKTAETEYPDLMMFYHLKLAETYYDIGDKVQAMTQFTNADKLKSKARREIDLDTSILYSRLKNELDPEASEQKVTNRKRKKEILIAPMDNVSDFTKKELKKQGLQNGFNDLFKLDSKDANPNALETKPNHDSEKELAAAINDLFNKGSVSLTLTEIQQLLENEKISEQFSAKLNKLKAVLEKSEGAVFPYRAQKAVNQFVSSTIKDKQPDGFFSTIRKVFSKAFGAIDDSKARDDFRKNKYVIILSKDNHASQKAAVGYGVANTEAKKAAETIRNKDLPIRKDQHKRKGPNPKIYRSAKKTHSMRVFYELCH